MVEVRVKEVKGLSRQSVWGSKGVADLTEEERGIVWEFISFMDWVLKLREWFDRKVFVVDVKEGERYIVVSSEVMKVFLEGLRDRGFRFSERGAKRLLRDVGLLWCGGEGRYQVSVLMEVRINGMVDRMWGVGYVVNLKKVLELAGWDLMREREVVELPKVELSEVPF